MPGDFQINDPKNIWQSQPTEPLKMSATDLRRKAVKLQSRARFTARLTIIIGIVLCVFFAWSFSKVHTTLWRIGSGLLSLCMIYSAYHVYKWTWPGSLPEEAPIDTCLEFYRRELEKQRDYNRRWWRSGLPVLTLLGVVMVAVGTGARNGAAQHPLLNSLPFFVILAIWAVAYSFLKKKHGRESLEREIAEMRAFEREQRS